MKKFAILLLVIIVFGCVAISGCTQQENPQTGMNAQQDTSDQNHSINEQDDNNDNNSQDNNE
jgi:hypothetical protein